MSQIRRDSADDQPGEDSRSSALIFEELNDLVLTRAETGKLIRHNLEQGLANEQVVRSILANFLPARYGVGKGKLINAAGEMSPHCDLIIYDALTCPRLFVDENLNQIIPAEGVYAVLEVKTTLTKGILEKAFEHLSAIYAINPRPTVLSTNKLVDYRPPNLEILALNYSGKLSTLAKHFSANNKRDPSCSSFGAYSSHSPGWAGPEARKSLVSAVTVLGLGQAHTMLDGTVTYREYKRYTLGIFLTHLVHELAEIELQAPNLLSYFNHVMADKLNDLPIAERPNVP